ncbi:MAG: hypothetical protein WA364_29650, partial [Candidatus Nitrosopolaris sp.]
MLTEIVDELRHLDGMKGNFMISESEYLAPALLKEEGKIASQLLGMQKDYDDSQMIFWMLQKLRPEH